MNTAGADQQQQQQHIIPFSANYPSFGGKKILNPSVSDVELVWNFIKVGFYFGSLLLCLSPVVTDACAPPASQEELEDELDDLLNLSSTPADDFEEEEEGQTRDTNSSKVAKKVTKQQHQEESTQSKHHHHQQSRWANFRQGLFKTARNVKTKTTHAVRVALLMSFISICAYTTWTFILAFLAEDRSRFVEFSQWIAKSDWMVSSYELVSLRPEQWFWSSQLLFFVVPMTLYIVIEHARSLRFYYDDCGGDRDGVMKVSKAAAGTTTTTTSIVECESAFRPLWNLWLGCGVAISVSFPLAMSSIVISSWNRFTIIAEKNDKITSSNSKTNTSSTSDAHVVVPRLRALRHAVPLNLCVILLPLIVAFACVVMIPVADSSTFGIVLGGLHFFIVLPPAVAQFFPQFVSFCPQSLITRALEKHQNTRANALLDWQRRTSQSMWIPISFIGFAAATLALHLVNFFHVLGSASTNQLFSTIVKGFCYNNCQCSISLDVVQCSIAVMIFIWFIPYLTAREKTILSCSTPILSLGVTFSVAIAINELRVIQARMITASSSPDGELFDLVFPSSANIFVDDADNDVEKQITLVGHRSMTTTTTAVISREKSNSTTNTSAPPSSRRQQFGVVGSPELNSSSSFNLYDRSSPTRKSRATAGTADQILSTSNSRLTESTSFNIDDDDRATNGSVSSSSFQLAKKEQHKQLRRQKTYLDDDDDDDEEEDQMFNKDARRVLSPEEWKKKRNLTRRKQELIRPVVGVVDTASEQTKKKKKGSIIVDEEDIDPAFASASSASSCSTATAEYDGDDHQTDEEDEDEDDLASEADSTSPRHPTNDEGADSRSSGMSGVYSENDD